MSPDTETARLARDVLRSCGLLPRGPEHPPGWLALDGAAALNVDAATSDSFHLRTPLHLLLLRAERRIGAELRFEGMLAPCLPGASFFPAGSVVAGRIAAGQPWMFLLVGHGRLRRVQPPAGRPASALDLDDDCMALLLEALRAACGTASSDMVAAANRVLDAICARLVERHGGLWPGGTAPAGLAPAQLARLEALVDANLDGHVPLAGMAAAAGLPVQRLVEALRHGAGITPAAFLQRRRCQRAQLLLAETELPLAEIALESGFSSQSQFSTAFRAITGSTPGSWRRDRMRSKPATGSIAAGKMPASGSGTLPLRPAPARGVTPISTP